MLVDKSGGPPLTPRLANLESASPTVSLCLLLSPSLSSSRITWAVGFFSFLATMSNSWRNSLGRYIWVLCIHLMYAIHFGLTRLFEDEYPLRASRKRVIQNHAYN